MILILAVLLAITLIYISEGPSLVRDKKWKELVTLALILAASLLLVVGKIIGIPSPMQMLSGILSPLGKALLGLHQT